MFNVLFVFTIAGAVLKSLNAIIREPGQVIESLGRNLPGVAPFFVNYVNLQGLFLTPLEFLRVGPLLLRLITRWWPWTITPRQYAATCEHEDIGIHYGIVYVFPLLVGTIGLTYSTIQPLIAPFTALYFAIALFVFKYLICYVHIPRYVFFNLRISHMLTSRRTATKPADPLRPCSSSALSLASSSTKSQWRASWRLKAPRF